VLAGATSLVGIAATASGLLVAWVATSVTLVALLGHKAPWPAAVRSQRLTARSFLVGDLALLLVMVVAILAVGDLDLRIVAAEAVALDAENIGSLRRTHGRGDLSGDRGRRSVGARPAPRMVALDARCTDTGLSAVARRRDQRCWRAAHPVLARVRRVGQRTWRWRSRWAPSPPCSARP
jgi:hypothetical protein